MKSAESTRAQFFWLKDFLTGGKIKRNFIEIKNLLEFPESPGNKTIREKYISQLLNHATLTVPYYKKFFGHDSLTDFPVVDKNIIRACQSNFISDSFPGTELRRVTTSGSTGAPLTVWQDRKKRQRHISENIYFSEKAGFELGSRLYYLRVWNEINRKKYFLSKSQNMIMEDAADLSDERIELLIRKLEKDKTSKTILGFSSTFEALAQYLEKNQVNTDFHVNCLIAISETLPEGARDILKKRFLCPVISRYSNMENGFLAQQCGDPCGEYHINSAGFHIELLHPERNDPAPEGQPGRIVVTDLFNFAMPFIRYDTGDIAIFAGKSVCGSPGPVFKRIEGRRVDFIYDTSGRLLSPHVITNTMWRYAGLVKQFQFIQEGSAEYKIKLNTSEKSASLGNQIIEDLKKYLGEEAIIAINYTDEIPLLASGKRKKIVNNYIEGNSGRTFSSIY